MADEKVELKDLNLRQLFPWTELFRGFQVALDPKKLLLAAGGIFVMAVGWWFWAVVFYSSFKEPTWGSGEWERSPAGWEKFKIERDKWNLLHEAAGKDPSIYSPDDLAESSDEYNQIKQQFDKIDPATKDDIATGRQRPIPLVIQGKNEEGNPADKTVFVSAKPYGKMRTWPWFEDRGPNPYLLVKGQAEAWERGRFWDWVVSKELPVLLEPLVKFLRPVTFLLHAKAGFWNSVYFILVLLWTLATWAFFGGAITRMAAVQIARKEKISLAEAFRFTRSRLVSYFCAPLIPLAGILFFCILLLIFGAFHMIPLVGDIVVDGLGWPLVLLAGLIMAIILVGLVGWPMMYATISAEGSDSFDALSRSYSYVLSNPWQYIWYSLVALAYGAVVVFFVGFMGSLMVYLGKWGVSQADFIRSDRDPAYLCIYAPTSFGWRDLLLAGGNEAVTATGAPVHPDDWKWYNYAGAVMVAFWLYVAFLMVVGFGYSYFWSASTIIYLLMRRKVDDTEMDEVYVEEDEAEPSYNMPITTSPTAPPPGDSGTTPLTMVEAPPAAKSEIPNPKSEGSSPPH
jgi:hypothetical protein